MRTLLAATGLVLTFTLLLWPVAALAQDTAPPQQAASAAIEKGRQGLESYEHGNWQDAISRFEEAEALYHSPVFLLYSARSLRNAGRLREASRMFSRLSAGQVGATAPEAWKQAQAAGRVELQALEEQLAASEAAQRLPPTRLATAKPRATTEPRKRGVYLPGLVITGVGSAAVVAGGVVGVLALAKRSTVLTPTPTRDNLPVCKATQCLDSQAHLVEPRAQTTQDLALAADVLWISGAAVVAIGVALMLIDPRADPAASAALGPDAGWLLVKF